MMFFGKHKERNLLSQVILINLKTALLFGVYVPGIPDGFQSRANKKAVHIRQLLDITIDDRSEFERNTCS